FTLSVQINLSLKSKSVNIKKFLNEWHGLCLIYILLIAAYIDLNSKKNVQLVLLYMLGQKIIYLQQFSYVSRNLNFLYKFLILSYIYTFSTIMIPTLTLSQI
ncbi:hypothetical protein H312_03006, partial [Anncaliia algerae PRA339]